MMPAEPLHLKNVLQAVGALEAVVLRSFGPEGGQVLFTRDTGQVMLSRSGAQILTALRLENPLARMVVECVWKHISSTGDGAKTFILLLASLLRVIQSAADKEPDVSHAYNFREAAQAAAARRLAEESLSFALEKLDDLLMVGVVPRGCRLLWEDLSAPPPNTVHSLLASFFRTRLGLAQCDFMSDLLCKLLSSWRTNHLPSSTLQFTSDNFSSLHTAVSGYPVSCSRVVEGQVIHRDFATALLPAEHQPVRAVAFPGYLQPTMLEEGEVLEIGVGIQWGEESKRKERSILHFNSRTERSLERVFANLQTLGVSLLLCVVKQSDAVLALATRAEMCVVECVREEELCLFTQLSGVVPVSDCCSVQQQHVATLTFCRPILLGAQRYVHVAFPTGPKEDVVTPCSLVVCGAGEGQTEQYARALRDAIHMLRVSWEPTTTSSPQSRPCVMEPGWAIRPGGTFEFLLHRTLLQRGCNRSSSNHTEAAIPVVSQILANTLLSVPRQVYSHGPRHFLQAQTRLLLSDRAPSHLLTAGHKPEQNTSCTPGGCGGAVTSEGLTVDSGVESVSCKRQLLLAVLQCAASLLRVDAVLSTRTGAHALSDRLTDVSSDTEDED